MRRMAHPSSRRGRRPAEHGDTERSIRLAALTRVAEQGFHATGPRDLAADAGLDGAPTSYKIASNVDMSNTRVTPAGAVKVEQLYARHSLTPHRAKQPPPPPPK